MAYTNTATTNTATAPSLLARASHVLDALATRYKEYRLYRETVEGLSALSNRELADLGISRSEIGRVALESVRG